MVGRPSVRWVRVALDCRDAEVLARFYSVLFGWEVSATDGRGWRQLRDPVDGVGLNVQADPRYIPPVWPEVRGAQAKMMHFEVLVDDVEDVAQLIVAAGGVEAPNHPPDRDRSRMRVMLDPAGHPFCIFVSGE